MWPVNDCNTQMVGQPLTLVRVVVYLLHGCSRGFVIGALPVSMMVPSIYIVGDCNFVELNLEKNDDD